MKFGTGWVMKMGNQNLIPKWNYNEKNWFDDVTPTAFKKRTLK